MLYLKLIGNDQFTRIECKSYVKLRDIDQM